MDYIANDMGTWTCLGTLTQRGTVLRPCAAQRLCHDRERPSERMPSTRRAVAESFASAFEHMARALELVAGCC